MTSVDVQRDGDRLVVVAPYAMKDRLKEIPSREWEPVRRAWTYPATEIVAQDLAQALPSGKYDALDALRITAPTIPEEALHGAWQHQRAAVEFAAARRGTLLFMGMGTGKTRCAVILLDTWKPRATLVLCPKTVAPVWPEQIALYGTRKVFVDVPVHMTSKAADARLRELHASGTDFVAVLNYDKARLVEAVRALPFDCVIFDEIHRCKGPRSQTCDLAAEIVAPFRLGLSGTPLPHSPLDGWGVMRAIDLGVYGENFNLFRQRYAALKDREMRDRRTGKKRRWKEIVRYQNLAQFNERFYRATFRADSDDVLDLPDEVHLRIPVDLPQRAQRKYDEAWNSLSVALGNGTLTIRNALSRLLRVQQITAGYLPDDDGQVHQIHSEKAEALRDLLADMPVSEPLVVFYRFRAERDSVRLACSGAPAEDARPVFNISGDGSELEAWRASVRAGHGAVLSVQIQSGAEGIDLTLAHRVVYLSVGWELAKYLQSQRRVRRPGQTKRVFYHHVVARNTVDELVYRKLQAREDLLEAVLQETGYRATEEEKERAC